MSNVIQIKRGNDEPSGTALENYELGIVRNLLETGASNSDINAGCLYIGENNQIFPVRTQISNSIQAFNHTFSNQDGKNPTVKVGGTIKVVQLYHLPDQEGTAPKGAPQRDGLDNDDWKKEAFREDSPSDGWFHIIKLYGAGNHNYTSFAIPLTGRSLFYKQVMNYRTEGDKADIPFGTGTDEKIEWIQVLDSNNYQNYNIYPSLTAENSLKVGPENGRFFTVDSTSIGIRVPMSTSNIITTENGLRVVNYWTTYDANGNEVYEHSALIHTTNLDVAKDARIGGKVIIGEDWNWADTKKPSYDSDFAHYGEVGGSTEIYNLKKLVLTSNMYGSSPPTNAVDGQLYFQYVEG